jgi:MinD-like ATPase involved in chromosome partitioning or flagellar assembly
MKIEKSCGYAFITVKDEDEGNKILKEIRHDHHDAVIIDTPVGLRIRYRDWF